MENSIPEFEQYLDTLCDTLSLTEKTRGDIRTEIAQNLYDKYNEYLIRGYGIKQSVPYVLKTFEEPKKLAKMFNQVYKEDLAMTALSKLVYNKKIIYMSMIVIFLATVCSLITAVNSFIPILHTDFGPLGWHNVDNNIFTGLALSLTLLVLYGCNLYNLLFKKLLPSKIIIWTAYINIILDLMFLIATK